MWITRKNGADMSNVVETLSLLKVLPDGHLNLSVEQLQQAGFAPGDRLVISVPAAGHLYLHKIDPSRTKPLSREALSRLLRDAFEKSGYDTREKIVGLVREVRQEMANER
jgi:hypothetical protein